MYFFPFLRVSRHEKFIIFGTDYGRILCLLFLFLPPSRSVSPNRKKDDNANMNDPSVVGLAPGSNAMFGGARAFKDMFDEAMQGGCVEVR